MGSAHLDTVAGQLHAGRLRRALERQGVAAHADGQRWQRTAVGRHGSTWAAVAADEAHDTFAHVVDAVGLVRPGLGKCDAAHSAGASIPVVNCAPIIRRLVVGEGAAKCTEVARVGDGAPFIRWGNVNTCFALLKRDLVEREQRTGRHIEQPALVRRVQHDAVAEDRDIGARLDFNLRVVVAVKQAVGAECSHRRRGLFRCS